MLNARIIPIERWSFITKKFAQLWLKLYSASKRRIIGCWITEIELCHCVFRKSELRYWEGRFEAWRRSEITTKPCPAKEGVQLFILVFVLSLLASLGSSRPLPRYASVSFVSPPCIENILIVGDHS